MTPLLHVRYAHASKPLALFGHLLLLLALTLTALGAVHAQPVAGPVLIVGDSLSSEYGIRRNSGWVELLRQRLTQQVQNPPVVINASISGDTTSGGLTRLPALLERHKPGLVVIELGGNDALRGLSLDLTRLNLTRMAELSKRAGATVVIVGMQIPPNYGPTYSSAFRDLFGQVATTTGSALVPFLLAGLETDRTLFIEDGIHPAESAQPLLLENVWPVLAPLLGVKVTNQNRPG